MGSSKESGIRFPRPRQQQNEAEGEVLYGARGLSRYFLYEMHCAYPVYEFTPPSPQVSRARRTLARHSSLSTDDTTCSSADNSPNVQRRSRLRCPPSLAPFRSPGAKGSVSPSRGRGGSSDLLQRAHTVNLRKGGRGTLRLSTHYDTEAQRLRVRVLAAQVIIFFSSFSFSLWFILVAGFVFCVLFNLFIFCLYVCDNT